MSSLVMSPPNLGAVEELCRLVLIAQRLGCTVRLTGMSDELRMLLDLSGVTGLVLDDQVACDGNSDDNSDRNSDRHETDLR